MLSIRKIPATQLGLTEPFEERNSYKALSNQKKELKKEGLSREWEFKIRDPP